MSVVRFLLLLLVAIAANSTGAQAQIAIFSAPAYGTREFDPKQDASVTRGRSGSLGLPQISEFGPRTLSPTEPRPQSFTTFEIVNEFDVPIYFQLGDGFQYFQQALGPRQSHVFRGPAGQPIYAAIDTAGEYQTFEIMPGVTHHIWAYEGWLVITP